MTTKISIRLNAEGGPEIRRDLEEIGRAGQSAFDRTREAADRAGAATDRQTERNRRLAQAARDAEAQARAQANVNALLGVTTAPAGAARASAGVFEAELSRQDQIFAARQEQAARTAQNRFNDILGVRDPMAGSARASAAAFEEDERRAAERRETIRTLITTRESSAAAEIARASSFQSGLNDRLGVQPGASSASGQTGTGDRAADIAAYGRALDDTRAKFSPLFAAQRDYLGQLAEIRQAVKAGALTQTEGATAITRTKEAFARQVGDLRAGAGPNRGLRGYEIQNLTAQGIDVGVSLQGGMNPLTVLLQQGGQIAPMFVGPGSASVKGALGQAGEAVTGFVSRIGLIGGAIGGVTVAASVGLAALVSYRSGQRDVLDSVSGIGRASGATVGSINALALATSASAGVSTAAAREMGSSFAATGRIGTTMYANLIGIARDYSVMTRQDLPDATKTLAEAFADPVRGAEQLNAQLGFLDATTKGTIDRLAAQGDRLGAQKALFEALSGSIGKADDRLGFFAREWEQFKRNTSNEVDAIGRFIDRGLGGGTAEERLATLQGQLAFRQRNMGTAGGLFDRMLGFDVDTIKKQIAEVQAEIDKAAKEGRTAELAQRGLEIDALVKAFNPGAQTLDRMERSAENVRRFLNDSGIDKDGSARRLMDGLLSQARQLREDMAAGGAAYADALRSARFEGGLVGATPFGRNAASINEAADTKRLQAFREAATDTSTEQFGKRLASIEEERKTLLDTLNRTQTLEQTQRGGAFGRAPADIQQMILEASRKYPTVPPEILAALGEKENGFRLSGPTMVKDRFGNPATTAWGYGQITVGAEADVRRMIPGFDRKDPSTAVEGAAAYLSLRRQWAGGDLLKALDGYGTGSGYGIDVMRRAGQLGDVSPLTIAKEQDARTRALEQEREALRLTTEAGGRDREGTLARIEAMKNIADAQGRGIIVSREMAAQFGREATERQRLATTGRLFQFANDNAFDRMQLGRTQVDAAAFARARQVGLGPDDPRAASVIEASRLNDGLRETKSLANEAFGGMLSDLRRGASLVDSLDSVMSRLSDRLISIAADKTISSLFAGTGGTTGDGPFAAVASFLFGGAKADGGLLMGPGGPRSDNLLIRASPGEYVMNAASVARYGPSFFDSLNTQKFADGGYVGPGRPPRDAFTMPRALAPQGAGSGMTVVINQNVPANVRAEEKPDGRGGRRLEVTIDEAVASALQRPGSKSRAAATSPRVATR